MRRANGTGSIVNLGPNRRNRYAVRVSYLDRPGLWKQKYISYHRTAKEAQEALEQYPAYYEKQNGEPLDPALYEVMAAPQEILDKCESYLGLPEETRTLYNDLWNELGI